MIEFLRLLGRLLTSMDAKAITSLAVSVILLVFVVLMLAFGQQWLNIDQEEGLTQLLVTAAESPWAVIGVVSIFVFLALTGFPQIFLITATVIVFGPKNGAIYSWIATMTSATLTFGIGHFLGGRWVRRKGGNRVQRTIGFIGRHGILASGLVRVVPSAPFIVVNAAAGAAHDTRKHKRDKLSFIRRVLSNSRTDGAAISGKRSRGALLFFLELL